MPLSSAFLGGITSPLGALVAASPPSALNEIQQLAALYEETQDEAHLKRVREIVKYVKIAKKAVEGMDKKQRARHRASTNSKWLDDVPNIAIYEFVYSDQDITIEIAQQVYREIIATWKDITPTRYPAITADRLKTLKYAQLKSGQYMNYKWFAMYITLGTYYLANRSEHPLYRPISTIKIKVSKAPSPELPSQTAVLGSDPNDAKSKPGPNTNAKTPAAKPKPKFGGPTQMQLDILEAVIAANHPVTQTDSFQNMSLMMQCYAAQGTGITPTPIVTVKEPEPEPEPESESETEGDIESNSESNSETVTNEKNDTDKDSASSSSFVSIATAVTGFDNAARRPTTEDEILALLATNILRTCSIAAYDSPLTISELVERGIETLEAGISTLSVGIDKGKAKIRRALSAKSKKKSGLTRVQEIQAQSGVGIIGKHGSGPKGGSVTSTLGLNDGEGKAGDEAVAGNLGLPPYEKAESEVSEWQYQAQDTEAREYSPHIPEESLPYGGIERPFHGILDPTSSSPRQPTNRSLESIVESISSDAIGSVLAESEGENGDAGGWRFMQKAKKSVENLLLQNDTDKMREQRREKRAKFEIED